MAKQVLEKRMEKNKKLPSSLDLKNGDTIDRIREDKKALRRLLMF